MILNNHTKAGLLDQMKAGRAFQFVAPEDLQERLGVQRV